jgi:general secretion pathway protein G
MSLAPPGANPARAAFTLLELLSVITIIAVLAGIILGAARRAAESGKIARTKTELAVLGAALENYRRIQGDYPRTEDEVQLLRALLGRRGPAADTAIAGRALLEAARFTIAGDVLVDPWGQAYVYAYKSTAPWSNSSYVLYSIGPDGRENPRLLAGGFPDAGGAGNADNIHAHH